MVDTRPTCLCVNSRLSRRDGPLLQYRPIPWIKIQHVDTRAPLYSGVLSNHVFQLDQEQELSKKAKWIQ